MRTILVVLLWLLFSGGVEVYAQAATPTPQSARQALIEMFVGKGANDFAKHLPEATRQILIRRGKTPETSYVLRISQAARQMEAYGEHFETFDVGPNILIVDQSQGHERIEITVEHDSLSGEQDEIELSIHTYKDGQPEFIPVIPSLIFTLQQEKEIWRLTEVTAAARVPLTDPDYLKGLRKEQDEGIEGTARTRLFGIVATEKNYASEHPEAGYPCALSGFPAGEETRADSNKIFTPISAGQTHAESNGYSFAISGCEGTPASRFRITAKPVDPDSGMKIFCADESGTVKSYEGKESVGCFSQGQIVGSDSGSYR